MTGTSIIYTQLANGFERRSMTCLWPCDGCALNFIANTAPGSNVIFDNEEDARKGCMMTDPRSIHGTVCANRVSATIPPPSRLARLRKCIIGK